jgi:phage terminase small subunit
MTPRQMRFVEEYARLKNAREAAIAAGYSLRCAAPIGSCLLRQPHIAAALAAAGVEFVVTPHGRNGGTQIRLALTARQTRFVEHYLVLGNAAEAARRAGYSAHSVSSTVQRLFRKPRVAAAIAAAQAARAERMRIDAEHVLAEYARLGFADLGMIADWSAAGLTLKPRDEMAAEERAALAEITEHRGGQGARLTVKLFDKPRALDALAKHLGLFTRNAAKPEVTRADGKDARNELRERLQRLIDARVAAIAKKKDEED